MRRVGMAMCVMGALAGLGAPTANATERELRFDTGRVDSTMVVGLYADDGRMYHPGMDFPFGELDGVATITVLVGLHVGSQVEPVDGEPELKAGVRVNGNAWRWQDLSALRDDQQHWVAFETPVAHWRVGGNRVEVTSTARNMGNLNARTVDIPCSFNPPARPRSYYSHDLVSWHPQMDRHWAIRLRYTTSDPSARPQTLHLVGGPERIRSGRRAQFAAVVEDADGLWFTPEDVTFSVSGAVMEAPGIVAGAEPGEASVQAQYGELEARVVLAVTDASWTGVLPADSAERLGPVVPEGHVGLNGVWDFATDPDDRGITEAWFAAPALPEQGTIYVPGCWQGQATDLDYHGIGWYRRTFEVPEAWRGKEIWIRFGAVATEADVWVNGEPVGSHMGNWAPFSVRVTDQIHRDETNTLTVRVRELPEHFSAGFARVVGQLGGVDNHFGGIWQEVSLFATGPARIEDVYAAPRLAEGTVRVETEVSGRADGPVTAVCTIIAPNGDAVARLEQEVPASAGSAKAPSLRFGFQLDAPEPWTPDHPALYTARVEIMADEALSDARSVRFGMRDVMREGHQILLNGQPISIRGILHWGYYPDLFTIDPSEERIRQEFRDLRAAGFNLVKVCLFLFPKRFYEIADEEGILLWQEYPLWQTVPHVGDTDDHDKIRSEYAEWIRFDRNHPSVVLRDLTCEANPAVVDMEFLGEIYDMAKAMTDDALLEDNSAFFGHGKTDFYDIHFYRDLDEMYALLPALAKLMREMPEIMPYVSGEDMDCDTYRDMAAIRGAWQRDGALPWWLDNGNFLDQERFEAMAESFAPGAAGRLVQAQNRHAAVMRKAMFEEMRRLPELTGYAMTGLRDITATRPGFYDDLMHSRWHADTWARFNSDRVLTLFADRRSRCYEIGETPVLELGLSNDAGLAGVPVRWRLLDGDAVLCEGATTADAPAGSARTVAHIELDWERCAPARTPAELRIEATLGEKGELARNDWPIWVFPAPGDGVEEATALAYSPDGSDALVRRLPGLGLEAVVSDMEADGWTHPGSEGPALPWGLPGRVLVTDAIDDATLRAMEAGARVIYVTRDIPQPITGPALEAQAWYEDEGPSSGSDDLPRTDAPFWREMAIHLPVDPSPLGAFPHSGFVDLQFLDMTQRRPFFLGDLRTHVTPLVWGVNCRFGNAFPVVDYVFEARAGSGRLLACSLNVFGPRNVAGRCLLRRLIEHVGATDAGAGEALEMDVLPLLHGVIDP